MTIMTKKELPRLIKRDTRQWSGGIVRFSIINIPRHPEKNYIIFEKNFFGKSNQALQKFIMHAHDWENLKRLIDGVDGLANQANWNVSGISDEDVSQIASKPELVEIILKSPSLGNFSDASLEALDKLGQRVYEIKKENLDLIFKRLAESSKKAIDNFSSLLCDLQIDHISLLSSLVYQKLKILDLLEKVVVNSENKEIAVHKIFESNPWILGKGFEIIQSDRPLSVFLDANVKIDPETKKRPDIIAKRVPYSDDIILVELKAPGIKLSATHIGQVLEYRALIEKFRPNVKKINCFIFGYEKASTFTKSNDAEIKTFGELIGNLRDEYNEYLEILEIGKEINLETENC